MMQIFDKLVNKLYDLFEFNLDNNNSNNKIERKNDLIPKGIKSTIKSDTYGNSSDYNDTWRYIYSQRRNLSKIK